MSARVNFYINLDKIDKSKVQNKKTGRFINLTMFINDDTKYGNNCGICMDRSAEERENGERSVFIGNGKVSYVDEKGVSVAEKEDTTMDTAIDDSDDDELPF